MMVYILRRLVVAVITVLGVAFLVVVAMRAIPGSAIDVILSTGSIGGPHARQELAHELGLDRPLPVQYVDWLGGVLHGDFGESVITGRSVGSQLREALPVSVELGIMALAFGLVFGIPVGVISAIRQDTLTDYSLRSIAIAGLSIPNFLVGVVVIVLASRLFNWTPSITYHPLIHEPLANLQQFVLPAVILGFGASAALMRFTRTAVLETSRADYVRTARAKGLSEYGVVARHIVRNALIPVISVVGVFLAFIVGGTVIFEQMFQLPGMGRLLFVAINNRDYPTIQSAVLVFASTVVLVNFLTDLAYTVVDPRVRL